MQFTFFHLMPYRPLDMTERHKYRAAWVVMPNTLYDPKKGADEYQSYTDQLVYAEKLGFDTIAVNEHHQTAYGIMPAPNLIAANLIARTTKAKIAIIGRALPLVNNPLNIAEEFAIFRHADGGKWRAEQASWMTIEYSSIGEGDGEIECRLTTKPGKESLGALTLDDPLDHLNGQWLEVDSVGHRWVGHDRCRI